MKKILKIYTVIAMFCCLCISCSKRTASEGEMYQYVLKKYGEATFVYSEKTDQILTCYYKDNEYQFDYWVESKISDFHMDGTSFFEFEKKSQTLMNNIIMFYTNSSRVHFILWKLITISVSVIRRLKLVQVLFLRMDLLKSYFRIQMRNTYPLSANAWQI